MKNSYSNFIKNIFLLIPLLIISCGSPNQETKKSYEDEIEGFWERKGTIQFINDIPVDTLLYADGDINEAENFRNIKAFSNNNIMWINNAPDNQNAWKGGAGGYGGSYSGGRFGGPGIICNILNATNAATAGVGEVIGTDVWYGGGGASSGNDPFNGNAGGNGGGGNSASAYYTDNAENGMDGTGGGGGASSWFWNQQPTYGIGGSGVVIMRYPAAYTCNVTSGTQATGSPFTEGSEKITVFKTVGNYQFNFTS